MQSTHASSSSRRLTTVRPSALGGQGTFAVEFIPRGAFIRTLTGEVVTEAELDARIRAGTERLDDSIRVGPDAYLDIDEESRVVNHSCEPNAGVRGQADLFALRDIPAGEEITFDYSTTVAPWPGADDTPYPETEWRMEGCQCGAARCRETIGDVLTIPDDTLRKYQQLGAFPELVALFLSRREVLHRC
jgi:SET domain-containing protein